MNLHNINHMHNNYYNKIKLNEHYNIKLYKLTTRHALLFYDTLK